MRLAVVALVALALVAPAAGAVRPKPWAWTAAQASARLDGVRCVGRGKAIQKRYVSFRCGSLWVRVRPVGRGEPCWSPVSLAAVSDLCLNPKGVRVRGSDDDAELALRKHLVPEEPYYQGPKGCVPYGLGFFECWYYGYDGTDPKSGLATVILLKTGAVVKITRQPTQ